jgi:hypothetical protein
MRLARSGAWATPRIVPSLLRCPRVSVALVARNLRVDTEFGSSRGPSGRCFWACRRTRGT